MTHLEGQAAATLAEDQEARMEARQEAAVREEAAPVPAGEVQEARQEVAKGAARAVWAEVMWIEERSAAPVQVVETPGAAALAVAEQAVAARVAAARVLATREGGTRAGA